jgi:hypothetical protein
LCKYCHNLLIDDSVKSVESEEVAAPEAAQDDSEKTIVYSKEELKKAMEQANRGNINADEVLAEAEEKIEDEKNESEAAPAEDAAYIEDKDDEAEVYTDGDDDGEEAADYDSKRTWIITAIITVGILIIVIAAVSMGSQLFGFGSDESSSEAKAKSSKSDTSSVAAVAAEAESKADEDSVLESYAPKVTDDTVSEDPEEIADSEASDPVIDSEADSTADSSADSSADSAADSAADDSSEAQALTSSYTISEPAGEYYSWNEAMQIWDGYVSANSLTDYGYSYGTDGVEMVFSGADASGETHEYRVDLQTGAVSVQ